MKPTTKAMIREFRSRVRRALQGASDLQRPDRLELAMGQRFFRNVTPRQNRLDQLRRYCVGCH